MYKSILVILTLLASISAHSIFDFGTITQGKDTTVAQEKENSRALQEAMKAANSSDTEKFVVIPAGAVISLMPCYFKQLTGVELRIEGTLLQTLNFASYPYGNNGFDQFDALLHFEASHHITLSGNGTIDGQGYMFWVREILGKNGHDRPYILEF